MLRDIVEEHLLELIMVAIQCGVLKYAWNKFSAYSKKTEARDDAVRSLLRTDIVSLCHKSFEKGYIVLYNRENLIDMFKAYKILGGNGAVESIYKKTMELPVVAREK